MNYEDAAKSLAGTTALWSLPLLNPSSPPEALGAITLETSGRLRTLGIMALLSRADDQQFLSNLSRSARAWALYLRRASTVSPRPHHCVLGRVDPILDGTAAGDWEALTRIATAAPQDKQGRSEYEDDYCYAHLLLGLTNPGSPTSVLTTWVERFRAFEDGARAAVCEALILRDAAGFENALVEIIETFDAKNKEAFESGSVEETPEALARSSVCVEGLALLRLADRYSIPNRREYPLCPSLGRTTLGVFPLEFESASIE